MAFTEPLRLSKKIVCIDINDSFTVFIKSVHGERHILILPCVSSLKKTASGSFWWLLASNNESAQ